MFISNIIQHSPSSTQEHRDLQRSLRMCACGDSCYPKDL